MKASSIGKVLALPCGRCIGCRLERARQWAVRLMHESEMHQDSSFITLTYDDDHLPSNYSISSTVAQLFMKRLRSKVDVKLRFFLCGEYGTKSLRPHYHALIFGYDFPDKVLLKESEGISLFRSDELDKVWGKGFCSIGQVTFDSACYVAKYALKQIKGPKAEAHYGGREPEFLHMSRRPGIGRAWIDKFSSDVYPSDEVIVNGFPARPPRYYDQVLKSRNPELLKSIVAKRDISSELLEEEVKYRKGPSVKIHPSRNYHRLETRRIVAEAKASLKSRTLEV